MTLWKKRLIATRHVTQNLSGQQKKEQVTEYLEKRDIFKIFKTLNGMDFNPHF